jgi:hypothetical protein
VTSNQLFFSIAGLTIAEVGFLKYYIDAKIDPLAKQMSDLVQYMILHEGKLATLEERTKNL